MRTRIALAPVIVGLVVSVGILHAGYLEAHQPTGGDCFGPVVANCLDAQAQGVRGWFPIAYVIVAVLALALGVGIGLIVGGPRKPPSA